MQHRYRHIFSIKRTQYAFNATITHCKLIKMIASASTTFTLTPYETAQEAIVVGIILFHFFASYIAYITQIYF